MISNSDCPAQELKTEYRQIFIVESLAYWVQVSEYYVSQSDLVLTYDLALKKRIEEQGGDVFFLDHLINPKQMQNNNFLSYEFFKNWYLAENGEDIFRYKDIPFGFSLRIEVWNDLISYVRAYLNLSRLNNVKTEEITVITKHQLVRDVLKDLAIKFKKVSPLEGAESDLAFFFPIEQWMDEKIRPKGVRACLYKLREYITATFGYIRPRIDKIFPNKKKKTIFIQEYHPTRELINFFRDDKEVQVLLANFSRGSKITDKLKEYLIPVSGSIEQYQAYSMQLMESFNDNKYARLVLDDGRDISDRVYSIISTRIHERLVYSIRTLDSCINYLDKHKVDLEVLIANIGHTATLFDCVCQHRGIPSYLIINGLLGPEYLDESKYASVINSYSESIKEHYFKGMSNIVVLGDPRMDLYPPELKKTNLSRNNPTITIGASGFNNVDLNSYVAVEFDFMHDVLSALAIIKDQGNSFNIIIKVRGNGYRKQYERFVEAYFPSLDCKIIDTRAMKEVLLQTDFYISIYSQTLFEASCLGIPVVYYKKDNEIMGPPFDGESELVTVNNIEALISAFNHFQQASEIYHDFLKREVMEKYVGPLDGQNVNRNIAFIEGLLEKPE